MSETVEADANPQPRMVRFADRIPNGGRGAGEPPLSERISVELIENLKELEARVDEWSDLAENASEPNVFYEPWMLLPALRAFGGGREICVALVSRHSSRNDTPPLLCGLMPVERRKLSARVPVSVASAWTHEFCYLTTPLLRRGHEAVCLEALFGELTGGRCATSLIEFPCLSAEGVVESAVDEVLDFHAAGAFDVSRHGRALLDARGDWEGYVASLLSSHHRSELRRQRRRLTDLGEIKLKFVTDAQHSDFWVQQFLDLERRGWKGRNRTAISQNEAAAVFFNEVMQGAAREGKLMLLGLFLNNEPIALKCNLLSGQGAFAFKIAYDESLEKFSPGVQLEIENIRIACEHPAVDWMDSCAAPRHSMINRLWRERRAVRRLLVSTGRWSGDAVVGLWPAARCVVRRRRRRGRPFGRQTHD